MIVWASNFRSDVSVSPFLPHYKPVQEHKLSYVEIGSTCDIEDSSWTCSSTTDNKTFSIMVLKESAVSLEVLKASPELPLHSELCLVLQSVSAGSP